MATPHICRPCRQSRVGEPDAGNPHVRTQLTAADEELTPTLKLKRSFVNMKYAKQIEAMHGRGEKAAT